MDRKLALLQEFYRGLPKDRAKVETSHHGFDFLDALLSDGITLEYGELTLSGLLHKYKLANIPEHRMSSLLRAHLAKEFNVCLYFDDRANSAFCFNLDNNHKTNNTVVIPEMELAVRLLTEHLGRLGCQPLVIASGRGYHLWCRLEGAVENDRLYSFMIRSAAKVTAALHEKGHDYNRIKINLYPDRRIRDIVSLRLFGSDHAKNKVFSRILGQDGLLDEEASWVRFEDYLRNNTIPLERFEEAYEAMLTAF
jgi:hypothetical protein